MPVLGGRAAHRKTQGRLRPFGSECVFALIFDGKAGSVPPMNAPRAILGGLLALLTSVVQAYSAPAIGHVTARYEAAAPAAVAVAVHAPTAADPRPRARPDVARLALAGFRPQARPPYMVRYPVTVETTAATIRPKARPTFVPRARWDSRPGSAMWTRAAMSAVGTQGADLSEVVPRDIERWCPAYATNSDELRSAFWVGMMSALSHFESTMNPGAVGGGGLWFGLLQISPDTAFRYGCRASSGDGLTDAEDNLSCAARIMSVTVRRDQAVALYDGRWRGVAADWGPMTDPAKIEAMANWTSQQAYCQPLDALRPRARPASFGSYAQATAEPDEAG